MRGLPSLIDCDHILPVYTLKRVTLNKEKSVDLDSTYLHPVIGKLLPFELPPAPRCKVL